MHTIKLMIDGKTVYEQALIDEEHAKTDYGRTIFEGFDANRNVIEYNGIVGTIQKWYYGSIVKSAWCATSMSYFANRAGCLDRIGGKNDNVNQMRLACKKAAEQGLGTYYSREQLPKTIPQYAILFWLWSGEVMTDASSKHVGLSEYASSGDMIYCIGGNQSDKICTKAYDRKYLHAVYLLDS